METWPELLDRQHDAFTLTQAAEYGVWRGRIRVRVDRGEWSGLYPSTVAAAADPGWLTWASGALLWVGGKAALGGATAAALHGLAVPSSTVPTIVVPAERRLAVPKLRVVRCRQFAQLRLVRIRDLDVLGVDDLVLQEWAAIRDEADRLTWLSAAVRRRKTTPSRLQERLALYSRLRYKAELRRCLAEIAGGAHTREEIEFGRAIRGSGLPEPTRQVKVALVGGGFRIVDGGWELYGVYFEIDGSLGHDELTEIERDFRAGNTIGAAGVLLRFTNRQAGDARYVVLTVATALAARGCPEAAQILARLA